MIKNVRVVTGTKPAPVRSVNILTSGDTRNPTWAQGAADDRRFETVHDSGGGVKGLKSCIIPGYSSGGGYIAKAVHFDGVTYLTNNSLGAPVTSLYSSVRWFKNAQSSNPTLFAVDPDNTVVPYEVLVNGRIDTEMSAGAIYFEGQTSLTFNDNLWHCEIFTFDGTSSTPANYKLYVGDIAVSYSASLLNNNGPYSIPGNGLKTQIGFDDAGDPYIGDLADFRIFYGISLLDGSGDIPLATRRLFIDGNGKPVDPAVATAALGASCILFSGDATAFAVNQGTGGAFTLTGTLTNASTSPSD